MANARQKIKGQTNDIDYILGKKLRNLRVERRISQTTLAKAIGVTFQQIQKYETGTNRISASRLYMIAYALNIPVTVFFCEETKIQVKQLAKKIIITP